MHIVNAVFRHARVASVAVCVCVIGGCGSSPAPSVLSPAAADVRNPTEVRSAGGVASLTLTAQIDPTTGAPAISYDGVYEAPTIRVVPGDAIDLTYVNALPYSSVEPSNHANLHFHGLSSSPAAPGDDSIDTIALPGQTLHYHVQVPATQPPGLYFYHSHAHGETDWQMTNGMSGAIVVEGTASIARETAGLPERIIILRRPQRTPSFAALARGMTTAAPSGSCALTTDESTTINGEAAPVPLLMMPGRPQLWRILNATSNAFYDLSVDHQSLRVVSLDGVPLQTYPGAHEMSVPDVVLPPAGRIEFIVNGPARGASAALRNTCHEAGSFGAANPSAMLASIVAGTPTLPAVAPPAPRTKGTYDQTLPAPAVQRTLQFAEMPAQGSYYLNGKLYDPSGPPMFTAKVGTVEEWTLLNESSELHTFHIHQVHFIVLDIDGVAQPPMWHDTVNLPYLHADGSPSVTHVLIDFRDPAIAGTLLFHCHILKHEDGGMMAKILVK